MFTAYAQDGGVAGGGGMSMLIMMAVFFAIFYFLLIRPQQKRQKEMQKTINSLKAGDVVMTAAGIIGTIDSVIDSNTFMLNLGNGVKVRIVKAGISGKYTEPGQGGSVTDKK